MPFRYRRSYQGPIEAVLLDWAGTTMDHGCMAPAVVFVQVFEKAGVPIAIDEARAPMGAAKRDHIQRITQVQSVHQRWTEQYGRAANDSDIDKMFADFVPLQLDCLSEYSTLIDGTIEVVDTCRKRGMKIGSTSGYNKDMMAINLADAEAQGYRPDATFCAADVPQGRPYPYMCLANVIKLGVSTVEACVKIDDTCPGIEEGLNAGMWSVGLACSGNEIGLPLAEMQALDRSDYDRRRAAAYRRMYQSGAHYVVDGIADVLPVLDAIQSRIDHGERS